MNVAEGDASILHKRVLDAGPAPQPQQYRVTLSGRDGQCVDS